MLEPDLRKQHRTIGIIFAFFIILQATGGLILSAYNLFVDQEQAKMTVSADHHNALQQKEPEDPPWVKFLHTGHADGGILGDIYHILLGVGLIYVAVSGSMISFKIRTRQKSRHS